MIKGFLNWSRNFLVTRIFVQLLRSSSLLSHSNTSPLWPVAKEWLQNNYANAPRPIRPYLSALLIDDALHPTSHHEFYSKDLQRHNQLSEAVHRRARKQTIVPVDAQCESPQLRPDVVLASRDSRLCGVSD